MRAVPGYSGQHQRRIMTSNAQQSGQERSWIARQNRELRCGLCSSLAQEGSIAWPDPQMHVP